MCRTEHVDQRIFDMDPHQHGLIAGYLAVHECKMQTAVEAVLVGMQAKITVLVGEVALGNPLHRLLVFNLVTDQVFDGADLEFVLAGEILQVRASRHGAVLIEDFYDHGAGLVPRQAREVTACLGMPRPNQDTTGLRHQRKDMAWLNDIIRPGILFHRCLDGGGAVRRRNACCHAFSRFNRHGEIRTVQVTRRAHHQRQFQLLATLLRQRKANQAAPVTRHEVDIISSDQARCHHQVAFVFTVFVIHDDHHFSLAKILDYLFDAVQLHMRQPVYLRKPVRVNIAMSSLPLSLSSMFSNSVSR